VPRHDDLQAHLRSAPHDHVKVGVLFDGDDRPYEIVGVVGNAKYIDKGELLRPTIYFNAFQEGHLYSQFSLRTGISPAAVAPAARAAVREVPTTLP
jgi:hypothetical protein